MYMKNGKDNKKTDNERSLILPPIPDKNISMPPKQESKPQTNKNIDNKSEKMERFGLHRHRVMVGDSVILPEEDGLEVEYKILDIIQYHSRKYAVLSSMNSDDYVIGELESDYIDDDGQIYFGDELDDEMLSEVYNLFEEKNQEGI